MSLIQLNPDSFENLRQSGKPLLVEFQAPWCTYCRRIEGAMDAVAAEQASVLAVGTVNIDDYPQLAEAWSVELVPTLILFQNGQPVNNIVAPESKAAIDDFIGQAMPNEEAEFRPIHDVVIIGGGPSGYTAALYAARAGLDTLVIEKLSAGGQMTETQQIDNYPGFPQGVDGFTLGMQMQEQAQRFGAVSKLTEVTAVNLRDTVKTITTDEGVYSARTVIIATGANHKHLGLPEETSLVGQGVGYCAACDGMLYRGKTVAVVGGGNSAAADALLLSRIVKKVILIHRRDMLRATRIYHKPLLQAENVEFLWDSAVTKLIHNGKLKGVQVKNLKTGGEQTVDLDGLFISIGRTPATDLFQGQLDMDENGYICADESTRTNLPGVFAAGDVRTKALRQVVTAVADGAAAAHHAEEYLAQALN